MTNPAEKPNAELIDLSLRPHEWYKDAVIYQIYPRSFQDTTGDGIGDLRGITSRLDYLAELGVDTLWLSPFFKSPMKDFGYDVSDYCDVDPTFGNLADFTELVSKAHSLGLRIIIDQVLSHTSDQHPWFEESRRDRSNDKANWYVWSDPKDDGTPPTNWLSIFGGSAWQWDARRRQYYLHNFLTEQPDLNFHEPQVQEALLQTMKFWLDLGVDGFRLDTVNYYFHDQHLRDNPPNISSMTQDPSDRSHSVYDHQHHYYDKSRPENIAWLGRMRDLCDAYKAILLGEIGCERQIERMLEYTLGDDKLHTAYSFAFMGPDHSAKFITEQVSPFVAHQTESWPCWATSNHDVKRTASRWLVKGDAQASRVALEGYAVLLATLFGTPCIYQGEELGLTEADLAFEDLVDPPGITFWPEYKGRDGCRTPMVWSAEAPNAGFSTAKPWLPVSPDHLDRSVDLQRADATSLHAFYMSLLKWRKQTPIARRGEFSFVDTQGPVLAYERTQQGQTLRVDINLGDQPAAIAPLNGELCFGVAGEQLKPGEYRVMLG